MRTIRQLLVEGVAVGYVIAAVEEVGFYTSDRRKTNIKVLPGDTGQYKTTKRSRLKDELCQWIREKDMAALRGGTHKDDDLFNQTERMIDQCGWPPGKLPKFGRLRDFWATGSLTGGEDAGPDEKIKRSRKRETAILSWLTDNGYNPKALPRFQGIKKMAEEELLRNTQLFTKSSFKHAWDRLRTSRAIRDQKTKVKDL